MKKILRFGMMIAFLVGVLAMPAPVRATGPITVTITDGGITDDDECSFREAVQAAANNGSSDNGDCGGGAAGTDTIAFAIPTSDSGYDNLTGIYTIPLTSYFAVNTPVFIDGTTQDGYSGSPVVRIDGNGNGLGLSLENGSAGSTVKGLMITRYSSVQLGIAVSSGTTVVGNYIGTDGAVDYGGSAGVRVTHSSNVHIGGASVAERNVIAGNDSEINLYAATAATVQGNYLGVFADGSSTPAGGLYGVVMATLPQASTGASSNQIGGLGAGEGNVIAGHTTVEVWIVSDDQSDSDTNTIQGNIIGLQANGTAKPTVFTGDGIQILNADNTLIEGNVISGKSSDGVAVEYDPSRIKGSGTPTPPDGTVIKTNKIGTSVDGLLDLGNATGIYLNGAANSVIGGNGDLSQRNLISGNSYGIDVTNGSGNILHTNILGMDALGTGSLPNTSYGLFLNGGDVEVSRNWVSGSTTGIHMQSTATFTSAGDNCIAGNTTGLNNTTGLPVIFETSWWGDASGPGDSGPGTGDPVSADVDFDPWSLSAAGICSPHASIVTTSLDFGSQMVGTSSTQTLSVANDGTLPLNFSSLGSAAVPFSVDAGASTCSTSTLLAIGANCLIAVKFAPTSIGPFSGPLEFSTDSMPPTEDLPLTGTGVAGTQLLKNRSFEIDANSDSKPDKWAFTNFNPATDKRDCTVKKSGACSLKFIGNGSLKIARQTIIQNGVAGDDFTFALWSRASSVPAGATYRLQVQFYNGAVLLATKTKNFNVGTHTFQKVSSTYTAPGPYTKIVYKISFQAASGRAWFDFGSLNWPP